METGLFPEECLTPAGIRGQNQVNAQNETHTSSHPHGLSAALYLSARWETRG